ncbi:MAG: dihydrolipoyl dehydrogenase [bacterium]|nr:dihydrolipoyl dehydrogenase [bacterium]
MIYDICIIGGGPGGYSAAIRGAQLGAKVALVEKESLGGTCLNHGCVPTKNLYSASEVLRSLSEADRFGIKAGAVSFDFAEMMQKKNEVVAHLAGGLQKLFKDYKIDIFKGKGSIEESGGDVGKVRVDSPSGSSFVEAENIIIATGSEAADIPPLRIDGMKALGNRDVLSLGELPDSLIIVGGGVIGCEFANILARMGVKVSLIEALDKILPHAEREISRLIRKRFEERGIKIITGSPIVDAELKGSGVSIKLADGTELFAEKALMAIGRRLNSFGLNLEEAGIEMDGTAIKVNGKMETSSKGVYAIGDVVGKMPLAHVAAREGIVAASNAMGKEEQMDYSAVPMAIYVHPEVASVGRGEEALKAASVDYRVGRFPYLANGKAVAMREEDGFVKVLTSVVDDKVLGVHIMGAHASDLIAEAALAMKMGCTTRDISDTVHAHPTLSEALLEAWEDTEGMAIHKMGKRII